MWITKGRAEPGPVFGNIGEYNTPPTNITSLKSYNSEDKFEGLGLFLDTYVCAQSPNTSS